MGLNPPLLHAFVRFNGQGGRQRWDAVSWAGDLASKPCLSSPNCSSAAETHTARGGGAGGNDWD